MLSFCHSLSCEGHFGPQWTPKKVLDSDLYWPTLFHNAYEFYKAYKCCLQIGNIERKNKMPQQSILFCEVFYVWGINFMGLFLASFGFIYILLAINYIFKWVKVIPNRTDNSPIVVNFVRSHLFCRFRLPRAIISDQGSYFYNRHMKALLNKYSILHKVLIPYHP